VKRSISSSGLRHRSQDLGTPDCAEDLFRINWFCSVARLIGFLQAKAAGRDCGAVRCYYMYYSVGRLQQFRSRVACQFVEVERDVLYCLSFRPHANPDYLRAE